jgi:hypothetical protein
MRKFVNWFGIAILIVVVSMLISMPAQAGTKKAVPVVNEACHKLADFAKSLATLKEVGFSVDGTKSFVVEPTVSPYPVHVIRLKIYAKDQTPEEVYSEFYGKCYILDYDVMLKMLLEEEALYVENAKMKADIEALVAENIAIMNKVTTVTKSVKK